jgi:hypothetical protein
MAMRDNQLAISGLREGVRLLDCEPLEACLATVLAGLPHKVAPTGGESVCATVIRANGRYRVHAPAIGQPSYHDDPVNAACELVGLVARYVAREPDRLVLHAAAVAANGALMVFPAGRRAGKSLLTVALSQLGVKVFGDDVLPIRLVPGAPIRGLALGASPRLRLPLPKNATAIVGDSTDIPSVENGRYRYLAVPGLAPAGEELPIGAFVTLRLVEEGPPRLEPFSRGAMLGILLKQNFGRRGRAEVLLSGLHALASSVPSYELAYRDPMEAASLLCSELAPRLSSAAPILEVPAIPPVPAISRPGSFSAGLAYRRREGVMLRELEGSCFASSPEGGEIVRLNEGLFQIWSLMDESATPAEIAALLRSAYRDVPTEQIDADVAAAFSALADAGLIVPAEGSRDDMAGRMRTGTHGGGSQ